MDVVTYAIPFFLLSIGVEAVWAARAGKPWYRLADSISDLACGILSQLAGIAFLFLTIGLYAWAYEHWALVRIPDDFASPAGVTVWVVAFIVVDHQYYWFHRLSHTWQIMWASHSVHHQSEDYNLTVALRQSATPFFSWPFYLPLALVGVSPVVFATSYGLNLIYQFFIHTQAVGKLPGWVEAVMNTPSHHRVHHGKNPDYCDRNHAGVFIVWDRLYRSFVEEREEPVYGVTVPLNSWNPVWANLIGYVHLFGDIWRTRSWWDKLRAPFMPPGWRPADLGPSIRPRPVDPSSYEKWDTPAPRAMHAYALAQFVLILPLTFYVLLMWKQLPLWQVGVHSFVITLTLVNLGALYERKPWARAAETARLVALLAVGGVMIAQGNPYLGAAQVALMLASLWGLRSALRATAADPLATLAG